MLFRNPMPRARARVDPNAATANSLGSTATIIGFSEN
jgi:hypothetical protein